MAAQPASERLARLRGTHWIGYGRASQALVRLAEMLACEPAQVRPQNLLIVGPANNGKTMIAERFRGAHPARTPKGSQRETVPVLLVQMPPAPAWPALRRPKCRDTDGAERLARLRGRNAGLAETVDLAEEFAGLLRTRQPELLGPWLTRARDGALPAFRSFARRLAADEAAVQAAATLPWSTGQVEGQINRLKMIKRQMYGRANLALLARRFLLAA